MDDLSHGIENDLRVLNEKQVLTKSELAAVLGISKWTVRGMRLKENCPHFTVGKRIFYRLSSVLQRIEQREQKFKPIPSEYGKIREIL